MKVQKRLPESNLSTVRDGEGGVFTFRSDTPLVEFNFVFINKGKIRGNHCHPEFDEFYLITSGNGVLVSKSEDGKEEFSYAGKGDCFFLPKGTLHVFYGITDCTMISLLSKKWNDCAQPIIHENLGMGTGDHGDPNYKG